MRHPHRFTPLHAAFFTRHHTASRGFTRLHAASLRTQVRSAGALVATVDQLEGIEPMHDNFGDSAETGGEEGDGDPPRVWLPEQARPGWRRIVGGWYRRATTGSVKRSQSEKRRRRFQRWCIGRVCRRRRFFYESVWRIGEIDAKE